MWYNEITFVHLLSRENEMDTGFSNKLVNKGGRIVSLTELMSRKVIELNDFRSSKPRKIWWWRKIDPLRFLQVSVCFVIIITAVSGVIFTVAGIHHAAETMWSLAFWSFVLFWALDYQSRKNFDLYKTED